MLDISPLRNRDAPHRGAHQRQAASSPLDQLTHGDTHVLHLPPLSPPRPLRLPLVRVEDALMARPTYVRWCPRCRDWQPTMPGTACAWCDGPTTEERTGPTVAPVPLRASCRALVARIHLDRAREHRDAAEANRRAAARAYGGDEESLREWRARRYESAEEADARAADCERRAAEWGML